MNWVASPTPAQGAYRLVLGITSGIACSLTLGAHLADKVPKFEIRTLVVSFWKYVMSSSHQILRRPLDDAGL
jgi:hypothetical protein